MVGITQPKNGEHVNADGVWDLLQNTGKMTVFSLCLLLCADLLDLAVGKSTFQHQTISVRVGYKSLSNILSVVRS